MRLDDLTLEVRDRTLVRKGQVTPSFMNFTARGRWCDVGEWSLTLPGTHPMVPVLAAPGSGIMLLGPSGTPDGVILSGPTRNPKRVRNQQNPDGTFTFSGVTDEVVLKGALAFPDPTIGDPQASSASRSNDTRTGKTEDLLRQFAAYNVAYTHAHSARIRGLRQYLTLEGVSAARGLTQQKSPRFQNLLELLQEIVAYDPSLGFRVVQVGGELRFQVLDARDRTGIVRFDVENGTVTSEEVQEGGPVVTDAIVAGQGEGTARTIVQRRSAAAIAAEAAWGVPFEMFVDQRDTDVTAELQQSGDAALLEGQGGTAVKMIPADDTTMRVGHDWRAGDSVTAVVGGVETVARVTEVAYMATPDGVRAGAALGDVSGFTAKDAESSTVKSLDSRLSNLERASAVPPDWADVTGKPSTFPPSAHSHDWADVTGKPSTFPPSAHSHDWASVTGKPSTFAPSAHAHAAGDVTSGVFAAARLPAATTSAIGAVELATQAETNAGTAGKVVTADTLLARDYAPFAMAAGTVPVTSSIATGSGVTAAVTFPSGRFSRSPIVVALPGGSARLQCAITAVSASGASIRIDNHSGANASGIDALRWVAIQMTSTGGAG